MNESTYLETHRNNGDVFAHIDNCECSICRRATIIADVLRTSIPEPDYDDVRAVTDQQADLFVAVSFLSNLDPFA